MAKNIRTASRKRAASAFVNGGTPGLSHVENNDPKVLEAPISGVTESAGSVQDNDRAALQHAKPMRMVYLHAPFNRFIGGAPNSVFEIPSMMSENERDFLFNIAKRYYRGVGRIVDAGIFLGGSTGCFSLGLRENPHLATAIQNWGKPIVSFERAVVTMTMPAFFARHGIGSNFRPGESFAGMVEGYVEPYRDLVDLRLGDIMEVGQLDDRIEILFLDVLKSPAIANFAISEYFTHLIPRRSLVIQQDYFFEGLPFIKVCQEFFGECFEYVGEVGSSAIFRCVERPTVVQVKKMLAGLDPQRQLQLASVAMQRSLDPTRRLMMALSKTRLIKELYGVEAARGYLAVVEGDYCGQMPTSMPPRLRNAVEEIRSICGVEPLNTGGA